MVWCCDFSLYKRSCINNIRCDTPYRNRSPQQLVLDVYKRQKVVFNENKVKVMVEDKEAADVVRWIFNEAEKGTLHSAVSYTHLEI